MDVEVRNDADREQFLTTLGSLVEEDPSLQIETDSPPGRIVLRGTSESHLTSTCFHIMGEHCIPAVLGKPRVIYVETIRTRTIGEGRYMRQNAGYGNYGHVILSIEPLKRDHGFEFAVVDEPIGIPDQYLPPIQRGIRRAMQVGILAGYEMSDIKATLIGGSHHAVDSNETAFQVAAFIAFQAAARKASRVVLEPFIKIEVVAPEEYRGAIIEDLYQRNGRCEVIEHSPWSNVILAVAPLAELLGYNAVLSALTQGRGQCSMQSATYDLARRAGRDSEEMVEEMVATSGRNPSGPRPAIGSAARPLDMGAGGQVA